MDQAPEASRPPVTTAKASLRAVERRRSERLLITVPIHVEGVDREGEKFAEETRTLVISREGARIYLKRIVSAGTILSITTKVGRRSGHFRVVGPTQPLSTEGSEWGVECQESNSNVWGIGFPPPASGDDVCAALIECRRCHAVKLSHLSMVEHEVLGKSGLLVKECEACGSPTSWGYKDPSTPISDRAADGAPATTDEFSKEQIKPRRRMHERVALQLPIRVRSFAGTEEFSHTENVSPGGLCFITDRNYAVGEILLITCPFEKSGPNIEVRSQVVRCQVMLGTTSKIYGVRYEG